MLDLIFDWDYSHSGMRIVIVLIFTDEPNMIDKVEIMGKLGKSDHNVLFWIAGVKVNSLADSKRIRDYKKGDFEAMRRELCMTNWEELLVGTTCDAWSMFKQRTMLLRR